MTWSYRIFRHSEKEKGKKKPYVWFGLHEVFYNEEGEPETYWVVPQALGETVDELLSSLRMMLKDAEARVPVLKQADFEKGGKFYASVVAFEKEMNEEIEEATKSLPSPRKKKSKK